MPVCGKESLLYFRFPIVEASAQLLGSRQELLEVRTIGNSSVALKYQLPSRSMTASVAGYARFIHCLRYVVCVRDPYFVGIWPNRLKLIGQTQRGNYFNLKPAVVCYNLCGIKCPLVRRAFDCRDTIGFYTLGLLKCLNLTFGR